jgi:hypothetical protein
MVGRIVHRQLRPVTDIMSFSFAVLAVLLSLASPLLR